MSTRFHWILVLGCALACTAGSAADAPSGSKGIDLAPKSQPSGFPAGGSAEEMMRSTNFRPPAAKGKSKVQLVCVSPEGRSFNPEDPGYRECLAQQRPMEATPGTQPASGTIQPTGRPNIGIKFGN